SLRCAPFASACAPASTQAPATKAEAEPSAPPAGSAADFSDWHRTVGALKLGGMALQLANNCVFDGWDGQRLKLNLDPAHRQMQTARTEENLLNALEAHCGSKLKLEIVVAAPEVETPAKAQARAQADRQREAEQAMADDPMVLTMEKEFAAQLVPGSVKPVD
ncbi:DNA polymerase III subunit gamma/tau C-terminal domain-containing protein, partial [Pseudomonadota bacterium]